MVHLNLLVNILLKLYVVHYPFATPNPPISSQYLFITPEPSIIHVHFATIDLIKQLIHDVFAFAL